jgi:hypothetical protein
MLFQEPAQDAEYGWPSCPSGPGARFGGGLLSSALLISAALAFWLVLPAASAKEH